MHLIALNCVLQNGEDGQLYPKYTLQRSLLKSAEAEEARQSRVSSKEGRCKDKCLMNKVKGREAGPWQRQDKGWVWRGRRNLSP